MEYSADWYRIELFPCSPKNSVKPLLNSDRQIWS